MSYFAFTVPTKNTIGYVMMDDNEYIEREALTTIQNIDGFKEGLMMFSVDIRSQNDARFNATKYGAKFSLRYIHGKKLFIVTINNDSEILENHCTDYVILCVGEILKAL